MSYTILITDPETNRQQTLTATNYEVLRDLISRFNKCFVQIFRNTK